MGRRAGWPLPCLWVRCAARVLGGREALLSGTAKLGGPAWAGGGVEVRPLVGGQACLGGGCAKTRFAPTTA